MPWVPVAQGGWEHYLGPPPLRQPQARASGWGERLPHRPLPLVVALELEACSRLPRRRGVLGASLRQGLRPQLPSGPMRLPRWGLLRVPPLDGGWAATSGGAVEDQ